MKIIFLGAPGSGKGTQAEKIAKQHHLKHISGGSELRKEVESGTRKGEIIGHIMARGELVPFETICSVTEPSMIENKNAFILDGTPRDLPQAEYLDSFFTDNKITIDVVIYLEVPEDKLIERLLKRAKLEGRVDDSFESIKERFVVFHEETEPVINYYEKKGLLLRIDGDRSIEEIATDIAEKLIKYEQ